jgi:sec-independent protein translocase protein TatB
MFDIGWPELLIVAVLVVIVVGPKDLPRVMRTIAHWVGKAKSMTQEFRGYVDDMVRESELDEVKRQIENGADLDPASLLENSIDPDREIKDAFEFGGEEFDIASDDPGDNPGDDSEEDQGDPAPAPDQRPEDGDDGDNGIGTDDGIGDGEKVAP